MVSGVTSLSLRSTDCPPAGDLGLQSASDDEEDEDEDEERASSEDEDEHEKLPPLAVTVAKLIEARRKSASQSQSQSKSQSQSQSKSQSKVNTSKITTPDEDDSVTGTLCSSVLGDTHTYKLLQSLKLTKRPELPGPRLPRRHPRV